MPLPKHIEYARELRKNQTPEEKIIWKLVRNKKLHGFKFLRQHPIIITDGSDSKRFYIADFYCAEKRLIVEIDGNIHRLQKDYDAGRDSLLQEMGFRTVRIKNEEIKNNIGYVVRKIEQCLQ